MGAVWAADDDEDFDPAFLDFLDAVVPDDPDAGPVIEIPPSDASVDRLSLDDADPDRCGRSPGNAGYPYFVTAVVGAAAMGTKPPSGLDEYFFSLRDLCRRCRRDSSLTSFDTDESLSLWSSERWW